MKTQGLFIIGAEAAIETLLIIVVPCFLLIDSGEGIETDVLEVKRTLIDLGEGVMPAPFTSDAVPLHISILMGISLDNLGKGYTYT